MIRDAGSKNGTELDLLDSQIISMLQRDGRRSNTDIARQLSVNEATVRKRIDRLIAARTIRVSAWADPLKLGYQTYANIEIIVHPPFLESAAGEIAEFPEIFFLGICTGNFDILAVGLFYSNDHMYEFLSSRLANVQGIDRVSTSHIIRTLKRDFPQMDFAAMGKMAGSAGKSTATDRAAGHRTHDRKPQSPASKTQV